LECGAASDTVLRFVIELSLSFPPDRKFAFEIRNGIVTRQYSSEYTKKYNDMLKGMVERRMRQSVFAVASFWYTAWVNAGQPDLRSLTHKEFTKEDLEEFESLDITWKNAAGREHE
jgi:heme oxygenase